MRSHIHKATSGPSQHTWLRTEDGGNGVRVAVDELDMMEWMHLRVMMELDACVLDVCVCVWLCVLFMYVCLCLCVCYL